MEQKEKDLLLKDLCARLPYNPVLKCTLKGIKGYTNITCKLDVEHLDELLYDGEFFIDIKPYLRPMSSMPEEEFEYLNKLGVENSLKCIEIDDPKEVFSVATKFCVEQIGYLYEHHYDVNGLIPSGHAIEVTEENDPYKD